MPHNSSFPPAKDAASIRVSAQEGYLPKCNVAVAVGKHAAGHCCLSPYGNLPPTGRSPQLLDAIGEERRAGALYSDVSSARQEGKRVKPS